MHKVINAEHTEFSDLFNKTFLLCIIIVMGTNIVSNTNTVLNISNNHPGIKYIYKSILILLSFLLPLSLILILFSNNGFYPFVSDGQTIINDYNINKNGGVENNGIYKAVRWCWKIKPSRANKYPYVLAVRYGIVVGVYQINLNGWKKVENSNRAYFDGVEASEEIKKFFLNKKVPERFRRRQNPASYCD